VWMDESILSPVPFRVLCNLWRRRNLKTLQCNPTIDLVAKNCRISRSTAIRAIATLRRLGFITRDKGNSKRSNAYRLASFNSVTRGTSMVSSVNLNGVTHDHLIVSPMTLKGSQGKYQEKVPIKGITPIAPVDQATPPEPPNDSFCISKEDLGQAPVSACPTPSAAPPPPQDISWEAHEAFMAACAAARARRLTSAYKE
jgi:hypothetical protein